MFAELKTQGYAGGYTLVTDFIRHWRGRGGKALARAFVPLKFELGEAFQFDWSEEGLVIAPRGLLSVDIAPSTFNLASRPGFGLHLMPPLGKR